MSGYAAIVGIGPGDPAQLTVAAREQIERSDILIGARRTLAPFLRPGLKTYELVLDYAAIAGVVADHPQQVISVLAAGDVGFYSVADQLQRLTGVAFRLFPGISSLQYFCCCLGESWQDLAVVSLHGREGDVLGTVLHHARSFFLLGGAFDAAAICALLCRRGLGNLNVAIGERLSYPEQRISRGTARELAEGSYDRLAVLLVYNHQLPPARAWKTPGLPDDRFLRGDVPMTKEMVRAAAVCKLRLRPQHVVYDIGAGTGSVAVECALQADYGWVYAIERSPVACALIEQNAARFAVQNLQVVAGEAPAALAGLPAPDRVFVGGAGGQLPAILDAIWQRNPRCRIVINAILLESAAEAVQALQARGHQPEVVQLACSVARPVATGSLMLAQNPVYIISGGPDDE